MPSPRLPRLPRLPADPDAQLLRWGWIAWAIVTVVLFVRYGVFDDRSALFFLNGVLVAALWILWPLYRGGRALLHRIRAARYGEWNGSYYEFDGVQVRVLFNDDAVWVVAADVYSLLDVGGRATDPVRVRVIAGRDGLVAPPGRRELAFTERGLAAWLERRTDAKAAAFRRWLETQVVAPYRRQRDVAARGSVHTKAPRA